jgi:hypothetical protein
VIHVLCYLTTPYQLLIFYGFGYKMKEVEEARREEDVRLQF